MSESFANKMSASALSGEQIDMLLRNLHRLATPPAAAWRLVCFAMEAGPLPACRQGAAMERLTELVEALPSAAVHFLRLAARGGFSVRSVSDAVACLGWDVLRGAVLSLCGCLESPDAAGEDEIDHRAFHRHTIGVAWAARELVRRGNLPLDPSEAYLAGLLHDIGELALRACMPRSYARVIQAANTFHASTSQYERSMLGVDHCVIGRRLAETWRLPPAIEQVIWLHHQPMEAIPASVGQRLLIGVVALADSIVSGAETGALTASPPHRTTEELAGPLSLGGELIQQIAAELPANVTRSMELIGLGADADELPAAEALADAIFHLGQMNEDLALRSRPCSLADRAMSVLDRFAQLLRPDATVSQALVRIAQACLDVSAPPTGADTPAGPAGAVVAYSIGDDSAGEVLALRLDSGDQPQWRTFGRAVNFDACRRPAQEASASEAMAALASDSAVLNDWLGGAADRHEALVCQGRWVGGVFLPAKASKALPPGENAMHPLLKAQLALSLAMVQCRSRSVAMSEELAGASQVLAQTQEALAERRTLAAVGEMASGAAHEINNPLAVISGRAQLMRERAKTDEERKVWQLVTEQAHRISDIITDLMDFASPPRPQPRRIELAALLDDARKTFSSSKHPQAARARVDIDIGDHAPPVWADPDQIQQVLVELIANAASACKGEAVIRLSAQADQTQPAVLLAVRDDGAGMDEQTLRRACTPFFSQQPAGRRRGMGLPRAKRCVESNGGRMWISSAPREGTTVYIQLPAAVSQG